jgi:hypothetical protein
MKTTATILALSFGFALVLSGFSGSASAQDKPAAGAEDSAQYKAKTVYDFDDDTVEGDLQRPDGELVDSLRKTKQSSLIEIRKDFIPEMLKSLEDI